MSWHCLAAVLLAAASPAAAPSMRVSVSVSGGAAELAPVIQERLGRRGTPVVVIEEAAPAAAILQADAEGVDLLLRVRVEVGVRDARLLFAHPTRGRFAIRRVELPRGLDEIGRESIGMVIDAATGSLLEGATLELTRAEAERVLVTARPPAPPSVVEQAPAPSPPLGLAVRYGAVVFAPGAIPLQHGPAVALTGFGLELSLQYLVTAEIGREPLDARFRTGAARLGLSRTRCGERFCLGGAAQAGLDLSWVAPFATDRERARAAPAAVVVSPMLRVAAAVGLPRLPGDPTLIVHLDGDLLGSRFAVGRPAGSADLVVPWRLRPGAALEVGWR